MIVQGFGLLLGGGGAIYLAPSLPPETRKYALVGGLAAAGLGAFLVLRGFQQGGGVVATLASGVFGSDREGLADETQVVQLDAPTVQPAVAPIGAKGAAALSVRVIAPADGGSVERGWFSGDYTVDLEVTNRSPLAFKGALEFHLEEDYLLNDESHVELRELAIAGNATQRIKFTLGLGSSVFVASPAIDLTLKVGNVELAHVAFEVNT